GLKARRAIGPHRRRPRLHAEGLSQGGLAPPHVGSAHLVPSPTRGEGTRPAHGVSPFRSSTRAPYRALSLKIVLPTLLLLTSLSATAQEPDRPMPRPGGPGGGIGNVLAPQIVAAVDTNKDGRISPDEAAEAAARFVREEDR